MHGGPLLPFLASPFALSARPRWNILLAQGIFAALAAALLVMLAPGGAHAAPWTAVACVAFLGGAPVTFYSAQIFPEILIGSFLALSLLLVRRPEAAARMAGYACLFIPLFGSSRVAAAVAAVAIFLAAVAARRRRWASGCPCTRLGGLSAITRPSVTRRYSRTTPGSQTLTGFGSNPLLGLCSALRRRHSAPDAARTANRMQQRLRRAPRKVL